MDFKSCVIWNQDCGLTILTFTFLHELPQPSCIFCKCGDFLKGSYACLTAVQPLSGAWLFVTLWTVIFQAPLSMEFSRQEYWNGLPCPLKGSSWPRDQTFTCLLHWFFTTSATWKPNWPLNLEEKDNNK